MRLRKKIVDKEFLTLHLKKQDSSTSTSETGRNACPLIYISSFVSYGVCICVQYFFDVVRNQTLNKKISTRVNQKKNQKFIKRILQVNVL